MGEKMLKGTLKIELDLEWIDLAYVSYTTVLRLSGRIVFY